MRRKLYKNRMLSLWLVGVMLLNLCGCGVSDVIGDNASDLMKGVKAQSVEGKTADDIFIRATADFAVKLFQNYRLAENETVGDNVLISPLSALLALSMTANGANGQTLTEMEVLLGGGMPIEELNRYLYTYTKSLPDTKKASLKIANSIWFRDEENRLSVEQDFLQTNADYYSAAVRKAPFDEATKQAINAWVEEKTDGMIDEVISGEIPYDTIMYLINALAFEAEWETTYRLSDFYEGTFTSSAGEVQTVPMMHSEETDYLDDGSATGFIKSYAGDGYSFAALLPNEGVDIGEYIASMTGETLLETLNGAKNVYLSATLPKFSYEDETRMNEELKALGMPTAFSGLEADFSGLGHSTRGNMFIGDVLQKTFISVDELGTKAGAVTKVEMMDECAPMYEYTVMLDRPFVYMIIDNATNLPIFIGAVMEIQK